jgi:5'-deoxynucleotidase
MSHFFAYLGRMKYIMRWGLMRNTREENIQEHSHQVAIIAHALAIIGNKKYNKQYDANYIAVLAMYHEASEVITGDLATPIKYFNPEIKTAYKQIENVANAKLIQMLPPAYQSEYKKIIYEETTDENKKIIKAADKIAAYLKCVEELKAGNGEFVSAKESIYATIAEIDLPEVEEFMKTFTPSYSLTLDQME